MIRSRWQTNTKPLDDLIEFADDFTQIATELGVQAFAEIEADFLDELRYYPPELPDQEYERTFTLQDGWTLTLRRTDSGFEIVIANDTVYTKRVVGSFAKARGAAARLQAKVHKDRWPLVHDTAESWWETFSEIYQGLFARELSRFGFTSSSQRAFTR